MRFLQGVCRLVVRLAPVLYCGFGVAQTIPASVIYQTQVGPRAGEIFSSWGEACLVTISSYTQGNTRFDYTSGGGRFDGVLGPGCAFQLKITETAPDGTQIERFNGPVFNQGWALPRRACPQGFVASGASCSRTPSITQGSGPGEKGCGNPILPTIGGKFQEEVDFRTDVAGYPLSMDRVYSSWNATRIGGLYGRGWYATRFDRKLSFLGPAGAPTRIYVGLEANRDLECTVNGSSCNFSPPSHWDLQLKSGQWVLVNRLTLDVDVFDTAGVLKQTILGGTRALTLDYSVAATPQTVAPGPGYLISATDPFGRKIHFNYSPTGALASVVDVAGSTYTYSSQNGLLSTVTYPDTKTRRFTYFGLGAPGGLGGLVPGSDISSPSDLPASGSALSTSTGYSLSGYQTDPLQSITDERGIQVSSFAYTGDGLATSTERAGGTLRYAFAYSGNTVTITDPLLSVYSQTIGTFGGMRRVTSSTQPAGAGCPAAVQSASYDGFGMPTQRVDLRGNRSCFDNDSWGREVARLEGSSALFCPGSLSGWTPTPGSVERKTSTEWHPDWSKPQRIAAPLLRTTFVYNGQSDGSTLLNCAPASATFEGKPLPVVCRRIEQPTSDTSGAQDFAATSVGTPRVWNFTYDKYGQVLTVDGPRTDVVDRTTFTYYPDNDPTISKRGRLATTVNALGHTVSYLAYNAYGQPLTIRDHNGIDTTFSYDARQRLLSMVRLGEAMTLSYDAAGAITRVTQPDGSWLNYGYDAAHRLTEVSDNAGNTLRYTLDNLGNRVAEQVRDSGGTLRRSIARAMDALGRVQSVTGAAQ